MSDNSWINHPALSGIDPEKLRLLSSLAEQAQGKSQKDLLPFLMSMTGGGSPPAAAGTSASLADGSPKSADDSGSPAGGSPGSTGMSFDPAETEAIINVMKSGKSPQEIQKIDRILSIMKKINK